MYRLLDREDARFRFAAESTPGKTAKGIQEERYEEMGKEL